MAEERRACERFARRVEVRFWRAASTQPHTGFTTNVSTSGLFLGTTHNLEPGERVRLELPDRDGSFIIEAQVVRVHRVSVSLRHIDQPGAGLRFLSPPDLLASLIPIARAAPGTGGRDRLPSRAGLAQPGRRAVAADAVAPAAIGPAPARGPDAASAPTRAPEPARTAGGLPVVVMEFSDRTGFLSTYHRDLASGSLHVSSDVTAGLHETVLVEIRPPLPNHPPLRFEATVVHRFEPRAAAGRGSPVLAGIGVRFRDPEGLRAALAPILAELRR